MPLRMLVDVDEVLSDFTSPCFKFLKDTFGRDLNSYDYEVWDIFSILPADERAAMYEAIRKPGFCAQLNPKPGAQAAIEKLRKVLDVYAVTSHFPGSPTWVHERDEWLLKYFDFPGEQIVHTRAKYLIKGDVFLDDNPEHIRKWSVEHPKGLALLWHIPNTRNMPLEDLRVRTWDEVLTRVLSFVEEHRCNPPG